MMLPDNDPRLLPISLRKELIAAGYTDQALAKALRSGVLARPRRGAYVDGPTWERLTVEQQYAVRCRAVYLKSQTEVALSHTSRLSMTESPLLGLDLADAHLRRLDGNSGRREAGVAQHGGEIREGDLIEANGLVMVGDTRTALDMTMIVPTDVSLGIVCDLLHRRRTSLPALRDRYDDQMQRHPHSLRTDLVLRLSDPRIESIGEARTLHFLFINHFPKPVLQYEIYDHGGRLAGRLDFAYPELGFWIEFDGRVKYEKYARPGESVADVVIREKDRENQIAEITGWRCFRIVWADLVDPVRLAARLRRFMQSVRASRRGR